mmetsp:Transcript_5225/g.7228  ORF Transcript_5225/g.7228 Transcript_5225/m.7228 type:complete len:225 (-) Transcript_5225:178-852(-)
MNYFGLICAIVFPTLYVESSGISFVHSFHIQTKCSTIYAHAFFSGIRSQNPLTLQSSTIEVGNQVKETKELDQRFMRLALRHAEWALKKREVPVGAVIVDDNGEVIATARNSVEKNQDATAHAEIQCLKTASEVIGNWRLNGCTLYCTLEPCVMCLGAIQNFRIKRIVYAAPDIRMGALGSYINLLDHKHPFHQLEVTGGVLEEESSNLLKQFFRERRRENDNT